MRSEGSCETVQTTISTCSAASLTSRAPRSSSTGFEAQLNRMAHIRECFFARVAIADAVRQTRT